MEPEKKDLSTVDVENPDVRNASVASIQAVRILEHSHDADEAMKAFQGREGRIEIDEATNKRLLRIIDWHILPLMCVVYGCNYLDKTTLSYSSIMGIKKDINITDNQYDWLSSMFYFGYLAWEYPTNRLLQRFPLAKYSGLCIVLWYVFMIRSATTISDACNRGTVLCCFAAVENFSGAVAIRFFLGLCEAAVTPGFALFTSQWYRKDEQSSRSAYRFHSVKLVWI